MDGSAQAAVTPAVTYATLQAALSLDPQARPEAQARLQAWEADATPGFIDSLLSIVAEVGGVDEVR